MWEKERKDLFESKGVSFKEVCMKTLENACIFIEK